MGTALILMGLVGLLMLLIVRQNIAHLTRTPWWLLWLVLMIPLFLITFWTLAYGARQIPFSLMVAAFFISTLLYVYLVRRGQIPTPTSTAKSERPPGEIAPETNPTLPPPTPEVRLLNRDEESLLQSCFPWSIFYLQKLEVHPQAAICRGQLRAQPETAYRTIQDNIAQRFGERYLLRFLMGASDKPYFALVPNPQWQEANLLSEIDVAAEIRPDATADVPTSPAATNLPRSKPAPTIPITRPGLALGLMLATLVTTTLIGIEVADTKLAQEISANMGLIFEKPGLLVKGLPYALGLMGILGTHELGHYLTARFYQMRATLPYFIPIPFALGTFGAFIQVRSPMPNRRVLFDVGIAGPLAGLVATIPVLLWGLSQSSVAPLAADSKDLNFTVLNPKISIMFMLFSKLMFGTQLTASTGVQLHPLALAGCLGLVVTALNLMPMGQLDGGHIVHAMYGQRNGAVIGQVTRLLVFILAFFVQPWLRFWAILLFFMPAFDEPALNDVSELDNRRDFLGLAVLLLLLLIILPVPDVLAQLILPATTR
jgi:hypothetical protein